MATTLIKKIVDYDILKYINNFLFTDQLIAKYNLPEIIVLYYNHY